LLDFVSRFHLPRNSFSLSTLSVIALLLAWTPGCKRAPGEIAKQESSPSAWRTNAALALVPPDAEIVLSLDLDRLRSHPLWTTVFSALAKDVKTFLDSFAAGTG
jgi:hypothetical protein